MVPHGQWSENRDLIMVAMRGIYSGRVMTTPLNVSIAMIYMYVRLCTPTLHAVRSDRTTPTHALSTDTINPQKNEMAWPHLKSYRRENVDPYGVRIKKIHPS